MIRIARYRIVLPLAALALAASLTGCAGLLKHTSQASGGGQSSSGSIVDLQQGSGKPLAPPSNFSCPNQNMRGCFTESQMETYFEYVLPYIDKFFTTTWPSVPLPKNIYFIPDGSSTSEACTDSSGKPAVADETAYNYCPGDDNVYIGQELAWELYSEAGDVAPATGLAHEFGHNVQAHVGVPNPQTNAQTLVHENQADCVSGAFLGFANNQGLLQQGDEPVLQKYLELISSSENDPNRNHGDFNERGSALELGGEKGIAACNQYYPNNPIFKS